MGIYLNPGASRFQKVLRSGVFVDKSRLIGILNKLTDTENCCICLCRPRLFGKTVNADMLSAYYSRGTDSTAIFDSLQISEDPGYKDHLNQHHTIHLDMSEFLTRSEHSATRMLEDINHHLRQELTKAFPKADLHGTSELYDMLNRIYDAEHQGFIFIIDDWDCLMRESPCDADGIRLYLDYLRALLKDQQYVSLACMSGILPIPKVGSHGNLNMFQEFSMTDPGEFAECFGFTESEVQFLCTTHGIDYSQMMLWYGGYASDSCRCLYNPYSVIQAVCTKKFTGYWTQTETVESLKKYLSRRDDGLQEAIIMLLAGETAVIDTATFHNDLITFDCKDDVLTLLIHLGYLTPVPEAARSSITADDKVLAVRIPNRKILETFRTSMSEIAGYKADSALPKIPGTAKPQKTNTENERTRQ